MPALFEGVDQHIETHVIFYFRHQIQYIPAAWKQWYSKVGTTLQEYIQQCLDRGYPSYLKSVTAWRDRLPLAKITVRPLVGDLLVGGGPDSDFLYQLGVDTTSMALGDVANRGLDFALIHLMMKNADRVYTGHHDLRAAQALTRLIGAKKPVGQAPILSTNYTNLIAERFKEENMELISKYCHLPDSDQAYSSLLSSQEGATKSYTEMSESEVIVRAFRILLAGLGVDKMSRVLNDVILDQVKPAEK